MLVNNIAIMVNVIVSHRNKMIWDHTSIRVKLKTLVRSKPVSKNLNLGLFVIIILGSYHLNEIKSPNFEGVYILENSISWDVT